MRALLRILGHQEWIKTPLRRRWIGNFHDPENAQSEAFSVPFEKAQYEGDFCSTLDWEVFYFGIYSREEMNCLSDILLLLPDPIVYDVGANCGHHSLFFALKGAEVHSFEPFPPLVAAIHAKIETNDIRTITVHPIGLGASDEILQYYPPADNHIGLGSFAVPTGAEGVPLRIQVADDYVLSQQLPGPNLVKIDVEGFEIEVLKGMSRLLKDNRPVIFVEWGEETAQRLSDLELLTLLPKDYRFFQFIDNSYVPRFKAFRKGGYELREFKGKPPVSNLVLAPNEFVELAAARFGRHRYNLL